MSKDPVGRTEQSDVPATNASAPPATVGRTEQSEVPATNAPEGPFGVFRGKKPVRTKPTIRKKPTPKT